MNYAKTNFKSFGVHCCQGVNSSLVMWKLKCALGTEMCASQLSDLVLILYLKLVKDKNYVDGSSCLISYI